MLAAAPREKRTPVIAAVCDWWQAPRRVDRAQSDGDDRSPDGVNCVPQAAGALGFQTADFAGDRSYDVSLLFRRMAMLHIDLDELAWDDPLLFRELQALCVMCRSRGRCRSGLAHEFDDSAWQDWRDYCPNATTLSLLSVVQMCSSSRL